MVLTGHESAWGDTMNKAVEEALRIWLIDELRGKLHDTLERIPPKELIREYNMDEKTFNALSDRLLKLRSALTELEEMDG